MQTDRRSFVKMLTYGALSCAAGEFSVDSLMADCAPSDFVCILLHGLFFMQFKGDKLIVATPQFEPQHTFGMREQGKPSMRNLPPGAPDINWSDPSIGLVGNTVVPDFPKNIPQFSSSATGVGEFMPAGTKSHQFQLILPRPQEIHGFRVGLNQFQSFLDSTEPNRPKPPNLKPMREDIQSHCGLDLALLTGLIYKKTNKWKHKNVVSFYAEHSDSCKNIKATDINDALLKGKELFANKANFDLFYKDPKTTVQICPTKLCDAFGVTQNDQFSVFELTLKPPACCGTEGTNPINCAQFGVLG